MLEDVEKVRRVGLWEVNIIISNLFWMGKRKIEQIQNLQIMLDVSLFWELQHAVFTPLARDFDSRLLTGGSPCDILLKNINSLSYIYILIFMWERDLTKPLSRGYDGFFFFWEGKKKKNTAYIFRSVHMYVQSLVVIKTVLYIFFYVHMIKLPVWNPQPPPFKKFKMVENRKEKK